VIEIFRPAVRDDSIPLFDAELRFARRRADRLSIKQPGDETTKPGLFRLIQCLAVEEAMHFILYSVAEVTKDLCPSRKL